MSNSVTFREATEHDLERIVEMLADDVLGKERERYETPLPLSYREAFIAIESDPNNELIVACDTSGIIGVQQITFTPHISRQGGWRATVEGVRIASEARGKGIGTLMMEWAIKRAKERNCQLIQLTTDKQRDDALQFYKQLGFQDTHQGLKMKLVE